MFSEKDIDQIQSRGSSLENTKQQIDNFKSGFPFLPLTEAATPNKGIFVLNDEEVESYVDFFQDKVKTGIKLLKFVPASGAASRMFKALFEAKEELENGIEGEKVMAKNPALQQFYTQLDNFAFANDLKETLQNNNKEINTLNLLHYLLTEDGLNYGNLPKGLLKFHNYEEGAKTPFEEHLTEGVLYARDEDNNVNLHFTVSEEHQEGFEQLFASVKTTLEQKHGVSFNLSFSQQKASTDTIAVDMNNEPFRNEDGSLLFRPGGHGALIQNLNDLDSDILFIKNIDNVVPDKFKDTTTTYKKALAGVLLKYQDRIFYYQKQFTEKGPTALSSAFLAEASNFLENSLCTVPAENQYYTEKESLYYYLKEKYNRPVRVCGMVKNEGEPGGGPFWAVNPDKTISLQVVESSQVDMESPQQTSILKNATHFNPVDLVCGIRNYKGEKYDLLEFTDPETGFISVKSKDGKSLKALELPGLWNGAMSNWITLFLEVPIETFNPVKTVNDLLREKHQ